MNAQGTVQIEKDLTPSDLHELAENHSSRIHGFTEEDVPNFTFRDPPCSFYSGSKALAEEAISGLGRAFFYAGARAVLVTSWPVETTSARALTTELFRRQAEDTKLSRAKALHQTMKALIESGGLVDPGTKQRVFSYAHPLFWAPFTLVGDGG